MKQLMGTYFSIGNAAKQYSDKMRSPEKHHRLILLRYHSRNFQDHGVNIN
jgi:hypothetical protein